MPTPSSNETDRQSPRSFPFSSCPDPEEQFQPLEQSSQTQPPMAPSTDWHPLPSSADPRDLVSQPNTSMNSDPTTSRSATLSPRPEQEAGRDVDMDREPEGMLIAQDDENHKRPDMEGYALTMPDVASRRENINSGAVAPDGSEMPGTTSSDALSRRQPTECFPPAMGEVQEMDAWGPLAKGPRWVEDCGLVGLGHEYTHIRVIPTPPSSFLRPGSRFEGTQQSERQRYDVEVEIKHVDLRESFLCGYLKIQGLTDDHPTLTTYFEGEIIGTKYGFITQHPAWGATEKIDLNHWAKFTAFRPFAKQARKGGQILIDVAQRENIFMRWKEHFLVPDHRVRTINGASFEGFYYICFNQIRGEVSGIYFHSKSEKFQQLELRHVDDKGCYGAMEFR